MIITETDRIRVCHLSESDAEFIFKLLNTPGWMKFIGNKNVHSVPDAENYIRNGPLNSYKDKGFGLYVVKLKKENISAGICGLIKRDFLEDIDLGFAFLPEYEGKGYAYESLSAVLNHAKKDLGISKLSAITDKDNYRSIKLLIKTGFIYDRKIFLEDEVKDILLYKISL